MNNDLRIKIKVDSNTGELVVARNEFDKLGGSLKSASTQTELFTKRLVGLAAGVVGIYTIQEAFKSTLSTGMVFNKNMEETIAGISALTVATSSNTSALGNNLSITEKYALANIEATTTAKELAKINAETPHTLNQTNQIYKAMFVSMKNAGASTEEMINLTKKISIAAGSAGIEFNALLSGVDGLATGTVESASEMGRFLSSLGLTNEALKESSDVVALLESKLGDFRAADTLNVALSNLQNSWEQLAGSLTQDIFTGSREGAKALSLAFSQLSTSDIEALRGGMNAFGLAASEVMYGITYATVELGNAFESLGARIAGASYRVSEGLFLDENEEKALEAMYAKTKENIAAREKLLESLTKAKEAFAAGISANPQAQTQATLQDGLLPSISSSKTSSAASQKSKEDREKIYLELQKNGYNAIIQLEKELQTARDAAMKSEKEFNDAWNKSEAEDRAAAEKKLAFENRFAQTMSDNYSSMLDSQIALAQSTNMWTDGLTGVAGQIAAVSKAMSKLDVDRLQSTKELYDLDSRYAKQYQEFSGDKEKLDKLSEQHIKDAAMLQQQATQNQIMGYSQMAGAMSQMFGESSKEAAAFRVIQDGLALSAAVGSIASAGMGDPYTAIPRVIAMTATMVSLLSNIGQTIGGSSHLYSSDALSAEIARGNNFGGTVFGDTAKMSESISNSLELMSDYAKPQYQAILDMSRGLSTLNNNIAKIVNQAISTGAISSSYAMPSFDLSGGFSAGNALSYIGKSFATGGIFTAPLDIFTNLVTALFGDNYRTDTSVKDYGAIIGEQLITSAMDNIMASAYNTVTVRESWSEFTWSGWKSKSKTYDKTATTAINNQLTQDLAKVFDGAYDAVLDAVVTLGMDRGSVISDLADFKIAKASISFNKTGEEIEKQFQDYISSQLDLLSDDALNGMLNAYKQVGEGLYETLSRVATEVTVVNTLLESINAMPARNTLAISDALIKLSGGLDNFSDLTSSYYDSFFTEAEKVADAQKLVNSVFDDFGLSSPTTNEQFRALVESLDITTSSGREAFTALMNIADVFTVVSGAADEAAESAKESAKESARILSEAWLGAYSPLSQLQKSQYANTLGYSPESSGLSSIEAAYAALEQAAKVATKDEEIRAAFNNYTALLKEQRADATNQDIVDGIVEVTQKLNDIIYRIERIEQSA